MKSENEETSKTPKYERDIVKIHVDRPFLNVKGLRMMVLKTTESRLLVRTIFIACDDVSGIEMPSKNEVQKKDIL